MNKYMGFYELKYLNIPTIPWKEYTYDTQLDDNLLWTIRIAVKNSGDLNLPRAVGVTAKEAYNKGAEFLNEYADKGIVIYYPYFIAIKSGVVDINNERAIIEAVKNDLWNLVTYGNKDITIIISNNGIEYIGNQDFINSKELEELRKYINIIKYKYRDDLNEGHSMIVEWSFALNTDVNKKPIGEKYLVFYELRSL